MLRSTASPLCFNSQHGQFLEMKCNERFGHSMNNCVVTIRFCRPRFTSNEQLMLYSLLYTMHAMSANLSPVASSSGFEQIDGDNFKVNIFQTVTGIKFIVISDLKQQNIDILLRKMYELYSDVLKDPLYTNNSQPIKNSLFDNALQFAIEQFEKTGNVS